MQFYFCFIFIIILIFIIQFLRQLSKKDSKVNINYEFISKYEGMAYELLNQDECVRKARSKYDKGTKIISLTIIVSIILFIVTGILTHNYIAIFFIEIFSDFIIIFWVSKKYHEEYINLFYNEIIFNLIKKYNENLSYDHYSGILRSIYDEARMDFYDRYNSEDLITGTILGHPFWMGDVHTEDRREDSDGDTYYVTSFLGTFAYIDLDKEIISYLCICSNRLKIFNSGTYVSIDNDEFEKKYDVFSDDEILAMRLLTPAVTSKILELEEKTGIYSEIKIVKKRVYIRLRTGDNFGLVVGNQNDDAKVLASYIGKIDSIVMIMENFIKELESLNN